MTPALACFALGALLLIVALVTWPKKPMATWRVQW